VAKKTHAKRSKKSNPTRKRAHAAKRSHAKRPHKSNPKRSHARRARKANPPKRTHAKRTHRRARKSNPMRKRSHARRSRKRNPAIPAWAMAGLAAGLGLVSYALGNDGVFALTQRTDPTLATLERNKYLIGGLLTVGGLVLAVYGSPVLGAGVAAGGIAAAVGTQVSNALGKVIDKKNADGSLQTAQIPASGATRIAGVFAVNGQQQLGAVFDGGQQMIGAVYDDGQQQLGYLVEEDYYGG